MKTKKVLLDQDTDTLNLVQMTDSHLIASRDGLLHGVNTYDTLGRVIAAVKRSRTPEAVLFTGDLADEPSEAAYGHLSSLLANLAMPVYCLPGNHDDPAMVDRCMNRGNAYTHKLLEGKHWLLILLDTVVPGAAHGWLSDDELGFLQRSLEAAGDKHVLIAMHHHPVPVNSPWMDTMRLENPGSFFEVVEQFNHVKAVIWGHIHQDYVDQKDGIKLLGTPSTCQQLILEGERPEPDDKPLAYRSITLHRDGSLDSEVVWVD